MTCLAVAMMLRAGLGSEAAGDVWQQVGTLEDVAVGEQVGVRVATGRWGGKEGMQTGHLASCLTTGQLLLTGLAADLVWPCQRMG